MIYITCSRIDASRLYVKLCNLSDERSLYDLAMNNSTPHKLPLKASNQNIVFAPFTPGQLNPTPSKRKYTKSTRLTFDTPSPARPQPRTPSQPYSHRSCLSVALTDCDYTVDGLFNAKPGPHNTQQPVPGKIQTERHGTPPATDHVSEVDHIINYVNNYLQLNSLSIWQFLKALFSSRDQQISAIVSRTLSSHGGELLDEISKKRPDVVQNWFEERMVRDLNKEGDRLISELLPPYGETLSSSLESFSMSSVALRTQACAPLLWKCLRSVGLEDGEETSERRNRTLVRYIFS